MPGISCEDDAGHEDSSSDDVDTGSEAEPDAGEEDAMMVDPSDPLAKLTGAYLMRVDYYSTARGTDTTGGKLAVQNRVSNLFRTVLTVSDGVVHASEQLCAQGSAHKCLDDTCSDWVTSYDVNLPAVFASKSRIERTWQIDPDTRQLTVRAEGALLPLGFDPVDGNYTLPSDASAANVWQLGSSGDPILRGVHTYITGTAHAASFVNVPIKCHVDSLMLFATAFNGTLPRLEASGLTSSVFKVDAAGSSAAPVRTDGTPTQFCDVAKLKSGQGTQEQIFVSFRETKLATCPKTAADYDQQFRFDAALNVDPPTL